MTKEEYTEPMTCSEAGKRGGAARKAKLGTEGYRQMGVKGGEATRERHGHAHYTQMGKRGGSETLAKYGREHFQELGKRGGAKVQKLIAAGRAHLGEENG